MPIYDTRNTNRHAIEDDIVESVLAHGTSSAEFLANCNNEYRSAAEEIADYYAENADIEQPTDHDGRALNVYRYAYDYFERHHGKRSGTAPNASLILTPAELAFIDERFGGSKSAAIHAALAALARSA